MWNKSESKDRPSIVEANISKKYVYVRRNIREIEREDIEGNKETFYEYEEIKIPKDVYCIFEAQFEQSSRLDDIEEVLVELIAE